MGMACSTNGEKRNAYGILVGKPEGKRPLGRPRRMWMDNIKMDPIEREWGGVDWVDLAVDRDQWKVLVNTVMNLRVPYNAGKFLSSCITVAASQEELSSIKFFILFFFSYGETESTWYCGHCLASCTSPR
jgi:hypothetical protein